MNTASELAKTVDEVHFATKSAVTKASKVVSENFDLVKDYIVNKKNSSNTMNAEGIISKEDKSDE